jgi:lysozyme family protein
MKSNFAEALQKILIHEGGFVDHALDPGGMTNLGVTRRVWEEWTGHPVTVRQMTELTPVKVAPMYRRKYWDKVRGDELPAGIDLVVFDAAVNSGPGRAAKWLQACVGVDVDGDIGPKTLAAVNTFDATQLIDDYGRRRLSFLLDLPTWGTFGKGWTARIAAVKTEAQAFV